MKGIHLTETEIQDCALELAVLDQIEHLNSCPMCASRVTNYRLILGMMDELRQPELDFDATELVMSRLSQPATAAPARSERRVYVIACLALGLVFVPVYLNRDDLIRMTRGLEPFSLYLIGLTTLVILVFQAAEMYRKHLRKLNTLISGDLQL